MKKASLIILIVATTTCYFNPVLSVLSAVKVSDHDLTFPVTESGSFSVYLSGDPGLENITIWFNYSDGNNLHPLPNDRTFKSGTNSKLNYVVRAKTAGHTTVLVKVSSPAVTTDDAFVRVGAYKNAALVTVSTVIGWLYFSCWALCFYPQKIENFRRRSVVGMNFDFVALNLTGYIAYSTYNICLRYVREVQLEYHSINPTGVIPVEVNDVVFALHGLLVTIISVAECYIYEHGDQKVSKTTKVVLSIVWSAAAVFLLLTYFNVNKHTPWLTFLYFCSYIKLGVTITKSVPQITYNCKRKSTVGWSIGGVLFDIAGGFFSMAQMIIVAYNFDDWYSIVGNFSKFGMGLFSMVVDAIYMTQHYILFPHKKEKEPLKAQLIN